MNPFEENKSSGLSREEFLSLPFWGESGYEESFYGYKSNFEESFSLLLSNFYNKNSTCLEIGCGAGFWSRKYLCPNFKNVIGLDLLPTDKISILQNNTPENFNYIEIGDRDYSCKNISDESIDFIFSFGVFCHLPNSAIKSYINSIYRKLKPGGEALIMFADFFKKKKYCSWDWKDEKFGSINNILTDFDLQDKCREENTFGGWFWIDHETLTDILVESNFSFYRDVSPKGCRDCIMHLKKIDV